jgi:branched-chain amino acid transport system permease protein
MDLLLDAVVIGVLLGCFYAAVSIGLSVAFGLLDVPHVAHPAFLVLASYAVFFLNEHYGIDPLLAGLLITPLFFLFGLAAYRMYYETFEKRGSDAGVRGIAFFFGIAFIIEVLIISAWTSARSLRPTSARPGESETCGFRSGWWSRSWSLLR